MPGKKNEIDDLYEKVSELQLDLHAARVAISVLSSCLSSLSGDSQLIATTVREALKANAEVDFDHQVGPEYQQELEERILQLL